ncbi:hypothetical protein [Neolewinella persica]|uniref:hypothetical protein n=1 Tax=Neolewinella persica TaxID=70998 RepID=UPI00035C480F|nr:hypothetical protein [Neolewinella persica]
MKSSLTCILLFFSIHLVAQASLFDSLHQQGDVVSVELDTDWKNLLRNKRKKQYQPLNMTVYTFGDTLTFPGRVRSRGHVRLEVCQNPSLKIKLKKSPLRAAGFSDLNDLKLVIQCSRGSVGEGYSIREQMVYELHAIYSENYHRVIPLQVTTNQDADQVLRAFLVEDEEQLSERYEGKIPNMRRASTDGINRSAYVNMCLFNYLILNTDWHVFNLHNVEFIAKKGALKLIPIPYDFDYSGFVGANYAVPREELDIASVLVPKWLGKDVSPEELTAACTHFQSRQEVATNFIATYPGLDNRNRKRLLKRMDDFYDLLANEKKLMRLLR